MAIIANNVVVQSAAKKKPEPVKKTVHEEPVVEVKAQKSRGLFAHKPSQFLNDMLNEQNKQE